MEKAEIIINKEEQNISDFQIEVRVEDDTVWLTQAQMTDLFQSTRNNITLHIGNVFKEGELEQDSVCKDSLLTASDGKKYNKQYPAIELKRFTKSHDRFLIIGQKDIYHIGASLKDLVNKCFAFAKIDIDPDLISKELPN